MVTADRSWQNCGMTHSLPVTGKVGSSTAKVAKDFTPQAVLIPGNFTKVIIWAHILHNCSLSLMLNISIPANPLQTHWKCNCKKHVGFEVKFLSLFLRSPASSCFRAGTQFLAGEQSLSAFGCQKKDLTRFDWNSLWWSQQQHVWERAAKSKCAWNGSAAIKLIAVH